MISLYAFNNPLDVFMRIEKKGESCWNYFIERGVLKNEISDHHRHRLDFLEEVLVNKTDLLCFVKELREVVKNKGNNDTKLDLTFLSNKPDFQFHIRLVTSKDRDFDIIPFYLKEKLKSDSSISIFHVELSFLGRFSAYKDTRPENQVLYKNKDWRQTISTFFSDAELLEFADEVEKEALQN